MARYRRATFAYWPITIEDVERVRDDNENSECYKIMGRREMSPDEYDTFCRDMEQEDEYWNMKGGITRLGVTLCIAVTCEGRRTLLVNPDLYSHALHVALPQTGRNRPRRMQD